MAIKIRRALIISLGRQGYRAAAALEKRLHRRHNGLPIVQTLALLTLDDQARLQDEEQAPAEQIKIVSIGLDEERWAALKRRPEVLSWLPAINDLNLNYRAGARLALLDHYNDLRTTFNDLLKKLLHLDSEAMLAEKGLAVASPRATTIDIYIVGNLAEPLAGGLLVDLAYLLRKFSLAEEADDFAFQINGLLLLPQLGADWDEADPAVLKSRQANAYAALKELDYYMEAHPYRLDYPGQGLTVDFQQTPPFEPGYCYLIGPTNESIETIESQDAVQMTAEWLYHILIAPVYTRLAANFQMRYYGPGRAIGAYGSLGLSSLILPMPYVRDYCARRLAYDLVENYLLAPAAPAKKERTERAIRDVQNCPLPFNTLRERLIGRRDENDRLYTISPTAFEGLHPAAYRDLETNLINRYDHNRVTIFPQIKNRMKANLSRLGDDLADRLRAYTRQLLDDEPAGAIDRTINFFEKFLTDVRRRQKRLQAEIRRYETLCAGYHHDIEAQRKRYFNNAHAVDFLSPGEETLLPAFGAAIALVIIFGYTYYFWAVVQQSLVWAGTFIGGGLSIVVLILGFDSTRIASSRAALIERYNSRLQTYRQLEEARFEAEMLAYIEGWALDLQAEVVAFRDELRTLRDLAQARWQEEHGHEAPWEQLLYGHPYFSLEESVIDAQDVAAYYREIAGTAARDMRSHLKQMFETGRYGGLYQDWFGSLKADAMWENLYAYCTTQAERLNRHYIVEKLEERYEQETVRDSIETIKNHARPFLKTRIRGGLGEDGEAPLSESIIVHFERDEDDAAKGYKVAGALQELRLLQNVDDFGQKNRLSVATARRGLPLYILPDVINCRAGYQEIEDLNLVHSTRGNIALPDISESRSSPVEDPEALFTLEARQVFALAVAFSQFDLHPFPALYYLAEPPASTSDGQSPAPGYYLIYVEPDKLEIAARLGLVAKKTYRYLGPDKATACAALYIHQELLTALRKEITAYLDQVEKAQLARTLYAYLYKRKETAEESDAPLTIFEDWEFIELENALRLLAHYVQAVRQQEEDLAQGV